MNFSIPTDLDRFREWSHSDAFPDSVQISMHEREITVQWSDPQAHQMTEITIPTTLERFQSWACSDRYPEKVRISFLDQEIFVDMSPEEIQTHNKIKLEITRVIENYNKKVELGEVYTDRVLLVNEDAHISTEPDMMLVTFDSLREETVRFVARESDEEQFVRVLGAPDLVLEVVSESSVRKDTHQLREQYFNAGVKEYWLVDARGEEIELQILIRNETDFTECQRSGSWLISPLLNRRAKLTRERNVLNLWRYTLELKSIRK